MDNAKALSRLLLTASIVILLLIGTYGTTVQAFTNSQSASLVIGQKDFTSSTSAASQSGLSAPNRAEFDSSGNMWVADWGNSRVLEFTSTPIPEFPTASLAIVALASLAVVVLVSRKFSITRLDR